MRRWRSAIVLVAASVAAAGLCTTSVQAAPSRPTAPPSASGSESVIVVLRNQLAAQPADATHLATRAAQARSSQDAVLGALRGAAPTKVLHFTVGNAFSATVSPAQAAQLAADPAVASVVPNRSVTVTPGAAQPAAGTAHPNATPKTELGAATVNPAACSTDPKKPVLEPEALQTINAASSDPKARTAAALGITGAGVKVAYIADGINPDNAGFIRANGTSAIVDYQDFYGDGLNAPTSGAEAFGDASAIAAQGNVVYDVADFSNPAVVTYPGGHCYIKIVGVAPGASIVALKAGSELLPNSAILQSIDYAVSVAHVNVINESFGSNIYPDSGNRDTIQLFNDQAVAAGVTITESSGDAGITSTIGASATDPLVISAGASTDSRLYEQTGYALAPQFGNGLWQDSNISSLSSAGITQNGRTIDVSAPGEADWAVCDDSGNFSGCASYRNPDHPYVGFEAFGGTSQASPMTAGVAALVIQAYRTTHGGASPTPATVKRIITGTARDLGLPGDEQGSGLIDARAATEAALTWPGATTAAPSGVASNVVLSANQLTVEGQPGTTGSASFTVTDVGTKPLTYAISARRYATLSQSSQTTSISTSSTQTLPYPTTGAPWVYKTLTFDVPSGADELASTIRWQSGAAYGGAGPVVRESLYAPDGTYAGNSRPQGGPDPANYGLVTIKQPAAGTWTLVLYTPATGGFSGTVSQTAQTYRALPVGTISPTLTSGRPGVATTVHVSVPFASTGGDQVYTVSVGSSDGHQVAVPVIARALVSTSSGVGRFAGTITGGNARAYSPAQTFTYGFDVPAGKPNLQVGVALDGDRGDLLEGVLVDPHDEVQSVNSNRTAGPSGSTVQGLTMQNTVAAPIPGRWRYVVVVISPVTGNEVTEGFTGTVAFNRVGVSGATVPSTLPAGRTFTALVKVRNYGAAPMVVQTDARTGPAVPLQLDPQFAGSTLQLPQNVEDLSQLPAYLVPPDTSSLSLTASTTDPAQIELSSPTNGIDVFGDLRSAQNGSTISTATVSESNDVVGPGYWATYVQQIGPFGTDGAPPATSVLSATAVTPVLDPAVRTSTGDPFAVTFDATAAAGSPLIVAPGSTGMIALKITPTGAKGSKVSGVLHLVTTPTLVAGQFFTTGEVLATLPYSYTVG